jgi:NADP-dependent 3-hydroxy acid dehydrogenase YdfG
VPGCRLAAAGARVVLGASRAHRLGMIADELRATGAQVRALTITFTRPDDKKAFVASHDRPPEH